MNNLTKENYNTIESDHFSTSVQTPLRQDAFLKSDEEKMKNIEIHFADILRELGMDLNDDSLSGTPRRIAKMFVKEIFSGLNPLNKPAISLFENSFQYNKMLIEFNISFNSTCEHHFLPIFGKAHIGYVSTGKVIGLSKINRIVDYYSRRPQIQERLTRQIFEELKSVLKTHDVIVIMEAEHLCVSSRGVHDRNSLTTTIEYGGVFEKDSKRSDFLKLIGKI